MDTSPSETRKYFANNKIMSLTEAPEEISANILSFLSLRTQIPIISSVCSSWRSACVSTLPVQYEHNRTFALRGFYPTIDYQPRLEELETEFKEKLFNPERYTFQENGSPVMGASIPSTLDLVIDALISNRKNNIEEVLLPFDASFIPSVFFYTYQSYMTAEQLLFLLFERFKQEKNEKRIMGVTFAIEAWIRQFIPQVLRHDESLPVLIIRQLLHFIEHELSSDVETSLGFAIYLRGLALKNAIENVIKQSDILKQLRSFPTDNAKYDTTKLFQYSTKELARQLTIREFELIDTIEPHEFVGYPWRKDRAPHKCPNLVRKMALFETLSAWVATEIVSPDTPEGRVQMIRFFIQLCYSLLDIRNFDTTFCIVGGLMSASVYRLKTTKELLTEEDAEKLEYLRKFVGLRGNFGAAREYLKGCETLPTLPYYGMYLGDLKSVHDIPLPTNLIKDVREWHQIKKSTFVNLFQIQKEYEFISELQRWKFNHSYYPLEGHATDMLKIAHVQNLINEAIRTALPVQDLFDLSLQREPRP